MANVYKYRVEDISGNDACDHLFDDLQEAVKYAQEHELRVIELEFEFADSRPFKDFTATKIYHKFIVSAEISVEVDSTDDVDTDDLAGDIAVALHNGLVALDTNAGESYSFNEENLEATYAGTT
jgi:hypothetical protein